MEVRSNDLAIFEGDRAVNYDEFVTKWIPNYGYLVAMLPKLLHNLDEKNVLIVGSGTGNEMLTLAESSNDWLLTGVDPSPEMITIAKKKLQPYSNTHLFEGELKDFKNASLFNAATLFLVLHFIKYPREKLELLKEIQKRLQPGAPLILMGIFGNNEQIKNNLNILERILSRSLTQREIDERFERIKENLHRTTEEELKKLLVRAGFELPTRFFQTTIYSAWTTNKLTI